MHFNFSDFVLVQVSYKNVTYKRNKANAPSVTKGIIYFKEVKRY